MNHHRKMIELLRATAEGEQLLALPGMVLNSGMDTVARSDIYVLGFNPGGDPENFACVEQNILSSPMGPFSGFNEKWGCAAGQHRHQIAVKKYLAALGVVDICTVPASNAYFLASSGVNELKAATKQHRPGGLIPLFKACWPVHEYLLSVIKPKVILCLGNGEGLEDSSFAAVRSLFPSRSGSSPSHESYRLGKWFVTKATFSNDQDVLWFGVPHPSRFYATDALCATLWEQADLVGISRP